MIVFYMLPILSEPLQGVLPWIQQFIKCLVKSNPILNGRANPLQVFLKLRSFSKSSSGLSISDADSDVLFEDERMALHMPEYLELKSLALKSAQDFLTLYRSIPDKDRSCLPARSTFYGQIPRTALEMYEHTKNVNNYYFGEIGVPADNKGTILECREHGFALLEDQPHFLDNHTYSGSYGEEWSLKKVLRRFIWHDRIHAKAMYRMAMKTFGRDSIPNVFFFDV